MARLASTASHSLLYLTSPSSGKHVTRPVILSSVPGADAERLDQLTAKTSEVIQRARAAALEPGVEKILRKWTLTEACEILGIEQHILLGRLEKKDIPAGTREGKHRLFTLKEIHEIQAKLGLQRHRDPAVNNPITLAVTNFKGGVGKTSAAIHLAQYMALKGYRVLAVDLDAQASMTSLFGILADSEVPHDKTLQHWFLGPTMGREDWTGTLKTAIQHTYWDGLDLIAANLALYGSEFALSNRHYNEDGFRYYKALADGIKTVRSDYDVIIIDTPPSLSFMTVNAIYAADALLLPVPPAMMDFSSASHFFALLRDVVGYINTLEDKPKTFQYMGLLLSKYQESIGAHKEISTWVQSIFGEMVIRTPMVLTNVLQNIGIELQTAYEVRNYAGDRRTFRRALTALNAINEEIESVIHSIWDIERKTAEAVEAAKHDAVKSRNATQQGAKRQAAAG